MTLFWITNAILSVSSPGPLPPSQPLWQFEGLALLPSETDVMEHERMLERKARAKARKERFPEEPVREEGRSPPPPLFSINGKPYPSKCREG